MSQGCDAEFFQVLGRQAREYRLVNVTLAECRLIFPEAQAPQLDHNVHGRAPRSGVTHIICWASECVRGRVCVLGVWALGFGALMNAR